MEIEGKMCSVYVLVRPGTKEFLESLAPFYEMVIYTASLSKYADPLMDILDPKKLCTARLFREHCTFYNNIFVKDLSKVDRDPKDLLILDNSPNSYLFQPESALPIVSWYDDMEDTILFEYIPLLQGLAVVDDVRDALAAFVYPIEPVEYDRIDISRGIELLDQYITFAKDGLIPEYELKNKTRVFSEPRNFKNNLEEEEIQDVEGSKSYGSEPNNDSFIVHNSAEVKASGNFTTDILNNWTNNKVNTNNKEEEKKNPKASTRPKSGSPTPTKIETGIDKFHKKTNPYLKKKTNPQQNISNLFRTYKNSKNISPINAQSGNHPQPHQRNIK